MKRIELLAPAGSFSVMKACIQAGADAIYMGLPKFSARAYAENAESASYLDAIRYAHFRNVRLYCTVNTLFKERELEDELEETIRPLYEAGLDAVIVQDLGVMKRISERFPLLPIHVSTQATVTGYRTAEFLIVDPGQDASGAGADGPDEEEALGLQEAANLELRRAHFDAHGFRLF